MLGRGHQPPKDSSQSSEDSGGPAVFEGASERGWLCFLEPSVAAL